MADEGNLDPSAARDELEEFEKKRPKRGLFNGLSLEKLWPLLPIIGLLVAAAYILSMGKAETQPVSNYTCAPAVECSPMLSCPNTSIECPKTSVNVTCGDSDMICSPTQTVKVNDTV